jgi:hypothetical protein
MKLGEGAILRFSRHRGACAPRILEIYSQTVVFTYLRPNKGISVVEYVTTIRVSIELLLTVGSLWWTIRTFVATASERDHLIREEDEAHSHLDSMKKSVKKMEDTAKKIRDKIIPGQMEVMAQLVKQIEGMDKNLKKSGLLEKVALYTEVKNFYTEQPDSRYFRASNYTPGGDDAP